MRLFRLPSPELLTVLPHQWWTLLFHLLPVPFRFLNLFWSPSLTWSRAPLRCPLLFLNCPPFLSCRPFRLMPILPTALIFPAAAPILPQAPSFPRGARLLPRIGTLPWGAWRLRTRPSPMLCRARFLPVPLSVRWPWRVLRPRCGLPHLWSPGPGSLGRLTLRLSLPGHLLSRVPVPVAARRRPVLPVLRRG